MTIPRVAAIHDLSAFGRCSLTIIIPTLSAMGVQCCPLLTAYLSTHTGGFVHNTFLDLTGQIRPIAEHWKSEGITFDAIYTGFLGSLDQMSLTKSFIEDFRRPDCQVIIDPVMGDHGKPYRTYTPEMCQAMSDLASHADVITPNRTEAAILLNEPYESLDLTNEKNCRRCCEALSQNGRRSVVLTGVSLTETTIGAACFDRRTGQTNFTAAPLAAGAFHGTGDLFTSVLTGALTRGWTLTEAARLAGEFTSQCARQTKKIAAPRREGVAFEPMLWRLGQRMEAQSDA